MAMWKIWNCQTLHKSLEITNALIAVHVTSQTLYTEVHNQKLGTGIQQTGMSRTPNEVSLSMPAIRFDVAVYGIIYGNISRVTVESWQCVTWTALVISVYSV